MRFFCFNFVKVGGFDGIFNWVLREYVEFFVYFIFVILFVFFKE